MWIARDKNENLWLFEEKPYRNKNVWCSNSNLKNRLKELQNEFNNL